MVRVLIIIFWNERGCWESKKPKNAQNTSKIFKLRLSESVTNPYDHVLFLFLFEASKLTQGGLLICICQVYDVVVRLLLYFDLVFTILSQLFGLATNALSGFEFCIQAVRGIFLKLNITKVLGLFVYSLYFRDQRRALGQFIVDFISDVLNDLFYCSMAQHHFLVMAFDLVSIPGLDEHGKVGEYPEPFPLFLRIEDASKVSEICDISIVLDQIPVVKLETALPLFDFLEQEPALLLLDLRCLLSHVETTLALLHRYQTIQLLQSAMNIIFILLLLVSFCYNLNHWLTKVIQPILLTFDRQKNHQYSKVRRNRGKMVRQNSWDYVLVF